jgi:hypothetical protein
LTIGTGQYSGGWWLASCLLGMNNIPELMDEWFDAESG